MTEPSSDPSGAESHWNAAYRCRATDAVSWFEATPSTSLAMIDACALDRSAPIIDIGGGASSLTGNLAARGYRDLAVLDIAQTALDAAQGNLGPAATAIDWIRADITAWQPPRRFALWHDRAVFHFLTGAADRARYIATLHHAIALHGHVIMATFAPDGPERCSGLPVMRYDAADIADLFAPAFMLRDRQTHDHRTPSGMIQHFSYARLQRVLPDRP